MPKSPRFPPDRVLPASPPSARTDAVRVIEMLAYPAVQLLDVTGPLQVFATANEQIVQAGGTAPYALRVVANDRSRVQASSGLEIATEPLPRSTSALDTLVVAGGPGVDLAVADPVLLAWLRRRVKKARRVASVCTGAFLLGASGTLDGRRAVTHWSYCSELARRFPAVRVEADPIFVRDGAVWTSAGVTSGIDLALALVEEDLGRATALAVARYLVVFLKRPGGQAQFSEALSLQSAEDEFGALHDWIGRHLSGELSLSRMARQAGMSERSFSRHYARATGQTPARAVERLRVEAARRMLSETRLPVKSVSRRCGFGSEETMRRSFLRVLAATPQDYRSRFGS
ncbi:GlxA family transcriptional regulator [Bradyrhizobium sp. BR 10289]|nr:GlxA family transcriptional regulator [Bradyrhizobium sp. BR 10289]